MAEVLLFYVRARTLNGEDMDLLVEAHNPVEATKLWDDHYDLEGSLSPDWVGEVKPTGKPGAIDWDLINPERS